MTDSVFYYIPQRKTTTLATVGGIDASQTTGIKLTSVAGVETSKPGIIAVNWSNPIDDTKIEYISYTSIDGSNELVGATRQAEGSTGRVHSNGVTIAFVVSASHINEVAKALNGTNTGVTLASPAITTPKITTGINDANGNEVIKTPATASAVNEITVTNAATGNPPIVSATGGDTNIDVAIQPKGTGALVVKGTADTAAEIRLSEDTDNGTNYIGIKAPASTGNLTFTLPSADGSDGHFLKTNGSGVLSFAAQTTSALSSKIITPTRDLSAASGDVAYTGVGFVPTSIVAYMAATGTEPYSQGFSDSSKTAVCIAGYGTGDFKTIQTGLLYLDVDGSNNKQVATVKTYDADGFTLTWTKTGSPTGTYSLIFICYK